MPTHISNTPSEENFEILDTPKFGVETYWGMRRAEAMKKFAGLISAADAVYEIRSAMSKDVRSGKNTFSDLFRTTLQINGLQCRSVGRKVFDESTEETRETKFPREQLCAHMSMTEQQYRKIDTDSKRRDIFFVLHSLFEQAARENSEHSKLQVPHMLLIEELATTLHQGGTTGFPLIQILMAGHTEEEFISDKQRIDSSAQDSKELTLTCTDTNEVCVFAKCWTPKWLGGGVTTQLQYSISFLPGQDSYPDRILYDGIKLLVAFPGVIEGHTAPHSEKHLIESMNSKVTTDTLKRTAISDFTYPDTGLTVVSNFKGKAFTARSMLRPCPEETPIVPSIRPQTAKPTASSASTPATTRSKIETENTRLEEQPRTQDLQSITTQHALPGTNTYSTDHAISGTSVAEDTSSSISQNAGENMQHALSSSTTDVSDSTTTYHNSSQTPDAEAHPLESQNSKDDEQCEPHKTNHDTTATPEAKANGADYISVHSELHETGHDAIEALESKTISRDESGVNSCAEQINNTTIWSRIRGFFSTIARSIQRLFASVKSLFCSCAVDSGVHSEQYSKMYEHIAGTMPDESLDLRVQELRYASTAASHAQSEATKSAHIRGDIPESNSSSIDVRPVGNSSSRSRAG